MSLYQTFSNQTLDNPYIKLTTSNILKPNFPKRLLMLSGNGLAGHLLNVSLGPVVDAVSIGTKVNDVGGTYISPNATMQTVCQTPKEIRGAMPR